MSSTDLEPFSTGPSLLTSVDLYPLSVSISTGLLSVSIVGVSSAPSPPPPSLSDLPVDPPSPGATGWWALCGVLVSASVGKCVTVCGVSPSVERCSSLFRGSVAGWSGFSVSSLVGTSSCCFSRDSVRCLSLPLRLASVGLGFAEREVCSWCPSNTDWWAGSARGLLSPGASSRRPSVDEEGEEGEEELWLARDEVRVEVGRESVFLLDN